MLNCDRLAIRKTGCPTITTGRCDHDGHFAFLLGLRSGPNLDVLRLNSDDGNSFLSAIAQGEWKSR
jgi:hypothetical protein